MDILQRALALPDLPKAQVTLCAVSSEAERAAAALRSLGIGTVEVSVCEKLAEPVASHADMLLRHVGGAVIFAAEPDAGYCRRLSELGFELRGLGVELGSGYPADIALNTACIGGLAMIGRRCPESALTRLLESSRRCVRVNQGYVKCSTAVISSSAAVTADSGIAGALRQNGLDVLEISPGGISIPCYDTGFIGGCCGLIAPDVLAFCGRLSLLPDGRAVRDFAREHGVYIEELTGGTPEDIGGILPLMERVAA